MIIKIVCAGQNDFSSLYKKDDNEFIIAVDGGIKAVKEKKLIADLLIGDFDSCSLSEEEYRNNYLKKMTFNARKDYSDLDNYGRCGVAFANLNKYGTMPKEDENRK